MEIPGGRGLKTPRPRLGCSNVVEKEVKKKKKNSLITKLITISFQLPS
jgi:hypothetical protein